jgi:hypothetical protein
MSGVATVSKTKELKTCHGADQVKNRPSQFWKEPSHASGFSFQRAQIPPAQILSIKVRHVCCFSQPRVQRAYGHTLPAT